MAIIYREPTTEDLPIALKLINSARKPYQKLGVYKKMKTPETTLEDLKTNSQGRDYRILVADGNLIGFCAFKKKNDNITWLSQFYIDPNYQRRGLGSVFLRYLEEEVAQKSKYLVLEYWPDAIWAENFYRKNGFIENPKIYKSKSLYTKVLVKKVAG